MTGRWLTIAVVVLGAATMASAATDCAATFTSGVGDTLLTWCVTQNGNVARLAAGVGLILDGAEGYALCGGDPQLWDLGAYGDSGNWAAATWVQPHGVGTLPLTITRASADGRVTLTQEFTFGGGGRTVRVKMSVATVGASVGRIYRYAHVSDGRGYGDHGLRSAFIWASGEFGLMAAPVPSGRVAASIQVAGAMTDPCVPAAPPGMPYHGDAMTEVAWQVTPNRKAAVSFEYVPIR